MRRQRQIATLACLACLLAGSASIAGGQASGSPAPPPAERGVRLRVPQQVADFHLLVREDSPSDHEVLLRFVGPDSLRADVFVYPGPDFANRCDSMCAVRVLEEEVANFRSLFPELIRRKYVDSIAVLSDETIQPAGPDRWRLARRLTLAAPRAGQAEHSELHLFYLTGARVKIRTSFVPTAARLSAAAAFAQALVPALTQPVEGAPPT